MAKDVSNMVQGLALAMGLIKGLNEKITGWHGYEEMLHFLTTKAGEENLEKVARLIVSLPWQVPLSLVKRLARDLSGNERTDEKWLRDHEDYYWEGAVKKLHIPMRFFAEDPQQAGALYHPKPQPYEPMPQEFREQLKGQIPRKGLTVQWKGEKYVVVNISTMEGDLPRLNSRMKGTEFDTLVVAPANRFVFDL